MFNQNLDTMIRQHLDAPGGDWHDATIDILHKVQGAEFIPDSTRSRLDFEALLDLLNARYERLSNCEGRPEKRGKKPLSLLTANYWCKYLF